MSKQLWKDCVRWVQLSRGLLPFSFAHFTLRQLAQPSVLLQVKGPVAVVVVFGKARTGKSFILNALSKSKSFEVSDCLCSSRNSYEGRRCMGGVWGV